MKHVIKIMQKAARCWAGYEPVPVTKGSKNTEKKAADFDVEHARRLYTENHIPGLDPVKSTPAQLWNRTRGILRPDSEHTSTNAAKLMRQYYNHQMPNMPQPASSPQPPQAPQQTPATAVKPPQPPAPVTSPPPAPLPASSFQRPKMQQMPADPVPAIDARLQRKGVDPAKPVFAKPAPKPPVTPQIVQKVTRPTSPTAPMPMPPPLKRVTPSIPPASGRVQSPTPQLPQQLFAQTPMR